MYLIYSFFDAYTPVEVFGYVKSSKEAKDIVKILNDKLKEEYSGTPHGPFDKFSYKEVPQISSHNIVGYVDTPGNRIDFYSEVE